MIVGKYVLIRPFELGDEIYLHKWWNDENMMGDSGLGFGTLQSLNYLKDKVLKEINNGSLYNDKKCFMICKKEGLKPIGEINYNGYDALRCFVDFMFKNLNLNKIELTTMKENIRAQNLYKKLGFKEIGIIRDAYFNSKYGEFSDIVYMDILKKEWLKINQKPKNLQIDERLRLVTLSKENWNIGLKWYQDKDVLYNSEGVQDKVYDLETIYRMYSKLDELGELYFIEIMDDGVYKIIGDVTLSEENMPIVIGDKKYWGLGIGKKVILKLLDRAKELGYKSITIPEIYDYNNRSKRLFKSVGFKEFKTNKESKSYKIYL
ncbi:GNAT family N-acetyltransferase [Paeniclostridium sordellii]|uniref:GNAT family N-acetyltransferase n=1 Tax=Paraclostridium sordellii TaxID=1505 RepID=UPI00214A37E5|nr:GNAT family protein [Paeniclostridium sordellii]MCR1849586.1 GNAT family N-acetyltransferase [Paeniclostridium sordellii]